MKKWIHQKVFTKLSKLQSSANEVRGKRRTKGRERVPRPCLFSQAMPTHLEWIELRKGRTARPIMLNSSAQRALYTGGALFSSQACGFRTGRAKLEPRSSLMHQGSGPPNLAEGCACYTNCKQESAAGSGCFFLRGMCSVGSCASGSHVL